MACYDEGVGRVGGEGGLEGGEDSGLDGGVLTEVAICALFFFFFWTVSSYSVTQKVHGY